MDEVELEVFRADTKASKGLSAAHIAKAAELYDADKAPAPLVFGHPKNDSPSYGFISGLRAEGSKLFAKVKNIADEVVNSVKERRILGRSIAFWDPDHPSNPNPGHYSVRHLGLLAGQAPAIPNMSALRFSADETELESDEPPADAVVFSVEEPTRVQKITEEPPAPKGEKTVEVTKEALEAAEARAAAAEKEAADLKAAEENRQREFAASEKTRRDGEDKAALDKAVAEGKVLPAERADFDALFAALPTQALTFSAGEREPRQFLAEFIDKLPKRAPVGANDKTPVSPTEFSADRLGEAQNKADEALEANRERLRNAHKGTAAA